MLAWSLVGTLALTTSSVCTSSAVALAMRVTRPELLQLSFLVQAPVGEGTGTVEPRWPLACQVTPSADLKAWSKAVFQALCSQIALGSWPCGSEEQPGRVDCEISAEMPVGLVGAAADVPWPSSRGPPGGRTQLRGPGNGICPWPLHPAVPLHSRKLNFKAE